MGDEKNIVEFVRYHQNLEHIMDLPHVKVHKRKKVEWYDRTILQWHFQKPAYIIQQQVVSLLLHTRHSRSFLTTFLFSYSKHISGYG
jgi:hypothetical protein